MFAWWASCKASLTVFMSTGTIEGLPLSFSQIIKDFTLPCNCATGQRKAKQAHLEFGEWSLVAVCVLEEKCKTMRGYEQEKTQSALWELVCDGWGFGHLPSDKISWQGNQRETNSAAAQVRLPPSSPWSAFEKWSAVEIGFVWEASDLSLVRIIATCLHWLQRSVN